MLPDLILFLMLSFGPLQAFSYVLALHVIHILHLCGVPEHLGQLLMVKLDLGLRFNVRKKLG